MCGISGLFGALSNDAVGIVRDMNDVIAHRGPSGSGEWMEGAVVLGHRRLSILDLSNAGAQPMHYLERYVIVYNGEVYNHIELRAELESLGYLFSSHTDTEVIIAAYAEWGEACLDKFNGMWAFALYDRKKCQLFLARDRFGVKPLYLWRSPEGFFAFASEIKQFTVLPGWSALLDHQCAYDFLVWGALDHTEGTLFRGVRQMRGGQSLLVDLLEQERLKTVDELPVKTWYSLPEKKFEGEFDKAVEQFTSIFEDAVRLRLRADVAVGSCLSGGLDSGSIVTVMSRLLRANGAGEQQKTFTYRDYHSAYDEWDFARSVVELTGVKALQTYPERSGFFNVVDQLIWHQDEPFGSTSIYAQWRVFEDAAENRVVVMLDGQGADELLAGYRTFIGPYLAGLIRAGKWCNFLSEGLAMRRGRHQSLARIFLYFGDAMLPSWMRSFLQKLMGRGATPGWLGIHRLKAHVGDPFSSLLSSRDSLQGQSRAQLTATNLQMLLHWEDRNSMAHSIEARVPFLDYRLVEFALSLPDSFKMRRGYTKSVLREAMKGILPEKVRMRTDKMGFVTAEEVWLRQEHTDDFRHALRDSIAASQGVLLPKALDNLEEMIAGKRPFSSEPWRQICFGLWMRRFAVGL